MMASTLCPCCGGQLDQLAGLVWHEGSLTLTGNGRAVQLTKGLGTIFGVLWKAFPTGRSFTRDEMMDLVYADDPNGGPESDNIISVQVFHLRKAIAPFGLSVKGYGYALVMAKDAKMAA